MATRARTRQEQITVPARLARGALGPRRRRPLLPLPERPGRRQLVPDARLGDADRLPRPGDDRRDPGDVLQAGADRPRTRRSSTSPTTSGPAGSSAACTAGAPRCFIILMFLHMGRVFLFGAYKYPRELNWLIGVLPARARARRGLHRLPAAVGPDGVLGDDGRDQPQRRPRRSSGPFLAQFLQGGPYINADTLQPLLRDPHAACCPAAIVA